MFQLQMYLWNGAPVHLTWSLATLFQIVRDAGDNVFHFRIIRLEDQVCIAETKGIRA